MNKFYSPIWILQSNEVSDMNILKKKKSKKFESPRKTNRTDPMTFVKSQTLFLINY